ncbi:F-box/FBD/LRR-repeat protein At5g53840 [Linum perenne]
MMEKESSSNGDGEDWISWLPDEILHKILDSLDSHKQAAKAALLSKRWNNLWLSYPFLEFCDTDYTYRTPSRSTTDNFLAAAKRKFYSSGLNIYIKSLKIVTSDSAVLEAAKDLIRNREPEEINMSIREGLIIPKLLLNYSRLRTLKLLGCTLLEDQYKMINLRVLHLFSARIDDPVLNSMIASAPLLEELNLMFVCYVKKVEFCNNANLKHLKISNMERLSEIVLVGAQQSLETLSLSMLDCHDLQIICSSLLPSLKSLEIRHFLNLRDLHAIHMLISKSPSLLSLRLVRLNKVNELKIESPTLEKLELVWYDRDPERVMFYIDAPRLVNVYFYGNIGSLHKMSHATNSFQAAQIRSSTIELSLVFKDMEYRKF